MRDENLHKISALADRTISDPVTANLLLCYAMQEIAQPLETDLLYDIAVTSDIINYFAFQDALQTMKENSLISCHDKKGKTYYTLTEAGADTVSRLHHLVGKSYRERIVKQAKLIIKQRQNEEQVKITYENLPQGCYLHVRITDYALVLLELTLFTPDEHQAKLLGDKILTDPSFVYQEILKAVMPDKKT